MPTSTVAKKANAVRTGKMYKLSGVVRSVNQNAPPPLNDGTFSTMFVIYKRKDNNVRKHELMKDVSKRKF